MHSLPIIVDANSPTPAGHIKLYITCADQDKEDKVILIVLIDMSHPFQVIGHLQDVLAQSCGVTAHRVKLSIEGETTPVSSADRISDVVTKIKPVDGVRHIKMAVEKWVPRVYSKNPFEMRKEWEMYRPVYNNTSDPW
jgi:hypothetical protein